MFDNLTKSVFEYNHWQNCHKLLQNDNCLNVKQETIRMMYDPQCYVNTNVTIQMTDMCKCFQFLSDICES